MPSKTALTSALSAGQLADDLAKGTGRSQLFQISVIEILHAVRAEMQVVFQLVRIQIIVPVEVAGGGRVLIK